jgi:uncharacterized protein YebE (UPF0316 family)
MEALLSVDVWVGAGVIFLLRVANMALDTLRALMVMRGRKGITWAFGFVQTMIYVFVLTTVIQDLTNVVNLLAYAMGFATGNVAGMWLEEKIGIGFVHMRVISPLRGAALAAGLREEGFAVTEFSGRGRDGAVSVLDVSVKRKSANKVHTIVEELDEHAFITSENLQPIHRGYWGK